MVTAAVAVLAFLGVLVPGASPTAAPAEPTCSERVVADWSDDGLIQGEYEIACYRNALDILPEDVLIYSSALDDISRAMREALAEQEAADKGEGATSGSSRRLSGRGQAPAGEDGAVAAAEAAPALVPDDSSSSRSLPLPLLLMAALTFALVLAASTSLLARRLRRRR
jgi:hypothetical protein